MDMLGGSAVNLSLGRLYGLGLEHGGVWLRLPFFFAGLLLATVAVTVFIVDINPPPREGVQPLKTSASSTLQEDDLATSTVEPDPALESPKSPDGTTSHQDLLEI